MSITIKQSREITARQLINGRAGYFIELQYPDAAARPKVKRIAYAEAERAGWRTDEEQTWGFPTDEGTHYTICVWFFHKVAA